MRFNKHLSVLFILILTNKNTKIMRTKKQILFSGKALLLSIVITLISFQAAQSAIYYIDPSLSANGDGTISSPYNVIPAITANNSYLLKSGTTYNITSAIVIAVNNVTLGAYGTGAKPIIYNDDKGRKTIIVSGINCRVTGLYVEVVADVPDGSSNANSGTGNINLVRTGGVMQPYTLTVDNCDIRGGHPGINGYGCSSIKVLNCDISNTVYDAHYSEFVDTVIYKNTYIHDAYVNVNNSNLIISIDLIHVKHCFKVVVDSCVLDHRNSPGKYCIIHHRDDKVTYANDSLVVSNTKLMGSQDSLNLGSCVKPSVYCSSFTNCIFSDAKSFMMDLSNRLYVNNCLFTSITPVGTQLYGISSNVFADIRNSTFIGIKNPYNSSQPTVNTIFWNCTGYGNYANSTIDPLFDADYNATAPSLVGVGYMSTGGSSSDTQSPSAPTNLASDSITSSSFTLSWTAATDNIGVTGYDVYCDGILATSVADTSASISNLLNSTTYSVTVKAKDAANNVSAASSALNVTTSPIGPSILFSDDMESGQGGWQTSITGDINSAWELGTPSGGGPSNTHSGTKCWGTNIDGKYSNPLSDAQLVTPSINLSGVIDPTMTFWVFQDIDKRDGGYIEISTDGGLTWVQIPGASLNPTYDGIITDGVIYAYQNIDKPWTMITVDLSAYADSTVKIKFHFITNSSFNAYGWYIDDVEVLGVSLKSASITTEVNGDVGNSLFVYPNPATNVVNIRVAERSVVKILDIAGKLYVNQVMNAGINAISLNNFRSGVYIIQVGSAVTKLVIR